MAGVDLVSRESFRTVPRRRPRDCLAINTHTRCLPMSSSTSKRSPSHWPPDIKYISETLYHSSVPENIRTQLRPKALSDRQNVRSPVAIQIISDPSHPARGQRGLFAAKKIPARTHIIDYVGEAHCDDRPGSDYDLSLFRTQDGISVGIDAQFMGNEARFINDYRGVKSKPNAVFEECRTSEGELRMSVWSGSESIRKGEEILVSYGKGWWKARSTDGN